MPQNPVWSSPRAIRLGACIPAGKKHQADPQHAVYPEQRRVTVQRRGVESLHVIQRDRRVNQEPEQSRSNQIPETHSQEEIDGPFVFGRPRRHVTDAPVLPGLETHQHQRDDFQGAENRAQSEGDGRRAGEIEMVQGPDDAARQVDRRRKQRRLPPRGGSPAPIARRGRR